MANSDSFYQEIVDGLVEVFEEFGTTYTVRTPGEFDEDTLEVIAASPRTVTGLVADQAFANGIGSIVPDGWIAKKSLILRQDAAPVAGEEVQVDGQWFPLSKVTTVKPAEIVVIHMLDITR